MDNATLRWFDTDSVVMPPLKARLLAWDGKDYYLGWLWDNNGLEYFQVEDGASVSILDFTHFMVLTPPDENA